MSARHESRMPEGAAHGSATGPSDGAGASPTSRAPCVSPTDAWLERQRPAMGAYNECVEAAGVFSDGLRMF